MSYSNIVPSGSSSGHNTSQVEKLDLKLSWTETSNWGDVLLLRLNDTVNCI